MNVSYLAIIINKWLFTVELLFLFEALIIIKKYVFQVASLSFTFWNRFSELLYEKQELKDLLSPYIYRLVMALRSHMLLDPSYVGWFYSKNCEQWYQLLSSD